MSRKIVHPSSPGSPGWPHTPSPSRSFHLAPWIAAVPCSPKSTFPRTWAEETSTVWATAPIVPASRMYVVIASSAAAAITTWRPSGVTAVIRMSVSPGSISTIVNAPVAASRLKTDTTSSIIEAT